MIKKGEYEQNNITLRIMPHSRLRYLITVMNYHRSGEISEETSPNGNKKIYNRDYWGVESAGNFLTVYN